MAGAGPKVDLDSIGPVRALLGEAGYTARGIAGVGVEPGLGVRAPDVPILLRALEPVEPLATLVRLFLLGTPVSHRDATRTLGHVSVRLLERARLVKAAHGLLVPSLRLTPWRGMLVAHDPDPPGELWGSHVAGPTPAADTLLDLVCVHDGSVLDLGTGCGLIAVALADRVDRVVATDVNPAALEYAAVTAVLNDAVNVETRSGSLFEPVAGDAFDWIVSNPPFVISPEIDLLFRHSEFGRDQMSKSIVRSSAAHLRDGGLATVMVNWVQPRDATWADVLADWVAPTGCDAVALLHGIEDPLAYALRWNVREQQLRPDTHPATIDRWLSHFRSEGIEAIGTGAIVLRRQTAHAPWFHPLELTAPNSGDAGPQVAAILAGRDHLAIRPDDAGLLADVFEVAGPHRVEQTLTSGHGGYVIGPGRLLPASGLGLTTLVEPELIPVLLQLDGERSLRAIVGEVAAATGRDADAVAAGAQALVRRLLEHGLVRVTRSG